MLANSEFRHELEGNIAPFKGLLLGLFLGVGASINFNLIVENPLFIFVFGAVLTFVKFAVLFVISRINKKNIDQNLLFAFGLSQAGEFGFVIMSLHAIEHHTQYFSQSNNGSNRNEYGCHSFCY